MTIFNFHIYNFLHSYHTDIKWEQGTWNYLIYWKCKHIFLPTSFIKIKYRLYVEKKRNAYLTIYTFHFVQNLNVCELCTIKNTCRLNDEFQYNFTPTLNKLHLHKVRHFAFLSSNVIFFFRHIVKTKMSYNKEHTSFLVSKISPSVCRGFFSCLRLKYLSFRRSGNLTPLMSSFVLVAIV